MSEMGMHPAERPTDSSLSSTIQFASTDHLSLYQILFYSIISNGPEKGDLEIETATSLAMKVLTFEYLPPLKKVQTK